MMFRASLILALALIPAADTALAAQSSALNVRALVLAKTSCTFSTATRTMNFGGVNPASTATVTRNSNYTIRCTGAAPSATFSVSTDSGQFETAPGAYRMRHIAQPSEFLSYSLTASPQTATIANNTTSTVTLTGSMSPADFQDAAAGVYRDQVILSISP